MYPPAPRNRRNGVCGFLQLHLTTTPRRHRLVDGQFSSLYAPTPSFGSLAKPLMLCCSPPASSSKSSRPCVYHPFASVSRTYFGIRYIKNNCDNLNGPSMFHHAGTVLRVCEKTSIDLSMPGPRQRRCSNMSKLYDDVLADISPCLASPLIPALLRTLCLASSSLPCLTSSTPVCRILLLVSRRSSRGPKASI